VKLIKQPNGWTCAAACVCMLTGTELEDFYQFCGHDGSEPVPVSVKHSIGVRCFTLQELAGYLLKHNMFFGWCFNPEAGFDPRTMTMKVDVEHMVAFVTAEVRPGLHHQLLWDGTRIIDPYCPEKQVSLSDYSIIDWWPVVRIP